MDTDVLMKLIKYGFKSQSGALKLLAEEYMSSHEFYESSTDMAHKFIKCFRDQVDECTLFKALLGWSVINCEDPNEHSELMKVIEPEGPGENLLCFIKFPSFSNAQWKELQTYKKICWLLPFVGMIDDFFEFQEKTLSSTCTKLHEKLAQKREKCLQKLMECSIKPSASYEISSSKASVKTVLDVNANENSALLKELLAYLNMNKIETEPDDSLQYNKSATDQYEDNFKIKVEKDHFESSNPKSDVSEDEKQKMDASPPVMIKDSSDCSDEPSEQTSQFITTFSYSHYNTTVPN